MKPNNIKSKTFDFAIEIVNLYKYLITEKKEYVMGKQILRAGTSIGANYREADNAQSRKDFIHKLAICQKEADETLFWLELLYKTAFIPKEVFEKLHNDGTEILKILKTISKNTKRNHNL